MKRTLILVLIALTIQGISSAKDKWKWMRRVATSAACVAAVADVVTTHGFAARGGVELNPLYRGAGGQPNVGLLIGTHAAVCAGSLIAGEKLRFRGSDQVWFATNAALASQYVKAAASNSHVNK